MRITNTETSGQPRTSGRGATTPQSQAAPTAGPARDLGPDDWEVRLWRARMDAAREREKVPPAPAPKARLRLDLSKGSWWLPVFLGLSVAGWLAVLLAVVL